MNIYREPTKLIHGCHLLIGNFDGVHLGHQQIIKAAKKFANHDQSKLACMIFNPHPRAFFGLDHQSIQTPYDQWLTLKAYGIDILYIINFNDSIANLSPESFIQDIIKPIGPLMIHVGADFHFGKNRQGNTDTLKKFFNVYAHNIHTIKDTKISSTQCRILLKNGNLSDLEEQLGRPFHISGIVRKGQQLGRQLGYPTANLHAVSHPLAGIYAATTILPDRRFIESAVSIGYRPFKPINYGLLESYLIDFNEDLYGKRLNVVFHKKIRDQKTFNQTEALVHQMDQDLIEIKRYFKEEKI
ncbi:MAG: riboflavin biosynthesis protein RibF [Pseudomonadota bacterium]|nr:riboflavin biosynthesis protein RibF [Pseudomonadota bacterium]